jgi:hypothetical protein
MSKSKRPSTRKPKKSRKASVTKIANTAPIPIYKHGFAQADWDAARVEAKQEMIAVAVAQRTMTYTELAARITSIFLQADDPRLSFLMDGISREESLAGRGMLTAVVVHKHDRQPGHGFFKLAKALGRNTSCKLTFYAKELAKVYKSWKQ